MILVVSGYVIQRLHPQDILFFKGVMPCPERFLKDGCRERRGEREREREGEGDCAADAWSQEFGAGWIIPSHHPHHHRPSTSTALLPLNSPLNPLHCSAVKSTSSPAHYSPPSAAFITKFMMKQFCVLLLLWSRYQGQTCSRGEQNTQAVTAWTPL